MALSIPAIVAGKRSPLPPDPSNTRLQGVYASIWQQSSPSKSSDPLARSRSNCERQPVSKVNPHSRIASPWPWQQTLEDVPAAQDVHDLPAVPHHTASNFVRPVPGNQKVWQLGKWLETETAKFNAQFAERQLRTPLLEFLILATRQARQLHSKVYYELTKQVTEECQQRGELMADVWIAYTTILETVIGRMHQTCLEDRDRAVVAESEKRNIAGVLGEEIQTLHLQNRNLQEEVTTLKKQVQQLASSQAAKADPRPKMALLKAAAPPSVLASQRSLASGLGQQGRQGSVTGAALLGPVRTRTLASENSLIPDFAPTGLQSNPSGLPVLGRYNSVLNDGLFSSLQVRPGSIIDDLAEMEPVYLAKQNKEMRRLLVDCRKELYMAYEQMADLEREADQALNLQSRLELAINERDAAAAKAEGLTPRPQVKAFEGSTPEGAAKLNEALALHRLWPNQDLADMLMGEEDAQHQSVLQSAPFMFGCLAKALKDATLTRQAVSSALASASLKPFLEHLSGQQLAWLQRHMQLTADSATSEEGQNRWRLLMDFVCGGTARGYTYTTDWYGALRPHFQNSSVTQLLELITKARIPTTQRVSVLEAENDALRKQLAEAQRKRAARSARANTEDSEHDEDEEAEPKEAEEVIANPIHDYITMLESLDEKEIKVDFPSMGNTADIPRVFKTNNRVRNKNITKRQTEMTVKEIWKVRMAHRKAGKAETSLVEMIFLHLQKTKGLQQAVLEAGYNLLYGCWKYSWDADCELFLKILRGEVKEDVYVEQIQLQEELEALFSQLDRAKGRATGTLTKTELGDALKAFFRVGQPGGKTEERHDELLQALDEDQEGNKVIYKKLFEEDREYNQGEFAEAVRDQFLNERIEYYKDLETAIANVAAADGEEMCTREHVKSGLLLLDPDMATHAVETISNSVFEAGHDQHSLPVLMKRLKATSIKRSRGTFSKMSIINKMKMLNISKRGRDVVKLDSLTTDTDSASVSGGTMADGQLTQSMKPGSKWKVVTSKMGQQGNPSNLANFLKALDKPPQLQLDVSSSTNVD